MEADIRTSRAAAERASQAGWRRAVAWIAQRELWWLALPVGLLLVLGLGRLPLWVNGLSLLVVPIPWICRRIVYGTYKLKTPLDVPIAGFLLMSLVGLYPSVDLQASLGVLIQRIVQVALLYGIVNNVRSKADVRTMIQLLILAGVGVAFLSLGNMSEPPQKLFAFPQLYSRLERLALPYFGSIGFRPNTVGGFLAIIFPISLSFTVFWAKGWRQGVFTLGVIMIEFGLLLTQSRGALLGVAVSLFILAIWRSRWLGLGILVAAAGLAVLARPQGLGHVADLVLALETTSTAAGRFELWQRAIYMLQDFPYTGVGMNTFDEVASVLYPFFLIGPDADVVHAHNLLLQTGVDTGIPGLVAYCGLLASILLIGLDTVRRARNTDLAAPAIGLMGSFVAYFTHDLVDYVDLSTKPGLAIWMVMGLMVALWLRVKGSPSL